MRTVLCILLLVSVTASASLIEDETTAIHDDLYYQEDGTADNHGGDAPDACQEADAAWSLGVGKDRNISGLLVQTDDEVDAYISPIDASHVGQRMRLEITDAIGLSAYELGFDVRTPDCEESVFDPNATLYDTSTPAREDPIAAGAGETVHEATDMRPYTCDASQWKFMIQQTDSMQPASIYVEYADRSWEYIALDHGSPSNVAMYLTSTNLEFNVSRVMFAMPDDWTGSFNVAHGPCSFNGTMAPPVKQPDALAGEFTVVREGDYVFMVFIDRDAVEATQDEVEGYVPPPTTAPVRCDDRYCSAAFDGGEYDSELFPISATA